MTRPILAPIVEGHGEVDAVPVLLRRMAEGCDVARPVRVRRQQVVLEGQLERYARIAEANIRDRGGPGAVVLLLDGDKDCAAELGPRLLERLRAALPRCPVGCAIAVRDFESWIVAGRADGPDVPDEQRGGKHWLGERLGRYVETIDQPRLCATVDLELASARSRSFRHWRDLVRGLTRSLALIGQASLGNDQNAGDAR
jgi:hypothetical protein